MKRLAVITTHPIQYYAPIFQLLHKRERLVIKVFYTWGEASLQKYDPGFRKHIQWDVPLLDGYTYEWVINTARDPGSHHFNGIVTPGLNEQIEDWKPDAVLIFGWAYKGHLSAMRYFKGRVPVLFRGDSTMLDVPRGIKSAIKSVFLRWVYRQVDYAFYTGTNNETYFKAYGLRHNQLLFAPHAIDNNRFNINRSHEAHALRSSLNLLSNDILILFAGKLEAKKDPLILLEAFGKVRKPDWHLLFVGNGNLENELKNNATADPGIHFMDFRNQSDMPVIYQAADLFCLPSAGPGESWGLAVNEAMASGKAILVSDKVGCAIDLVKNNTNGEIFKSRSVSALTDALLRLAADKERLAEMGRQSQKIIQSWNFNSIAVAIEELLNQSEPR